MVCIWSMNNIQHHLPKLLQSRRRMKNDLLKLMFSSLEFDIKVLLPTFPIFFKILYVQIYNIIYRYSDIQMYTGQVTFKDMAEQWIEWLPSNKIFSLFYLSFTKWLVNVHSALMSFIIYDYGKGIGNFLRQD